MLLEILINYKRPETLKVINMNKYLNNITMEEIDRTSLIRFKRREGNLYIYLENYKQIVESVKSNFSMLFAEKVVDVLNRSDIDDSQKEILVYAIASAHLFSLLLVDVYCEGKVK